MEFSGKDTSFGNKWGKDSDGHECLTKQWFFDVQWSNCPVEIESVIRKLWQDYELGNDRYILKGTLEDYNEMCDDEWDVDSQKFIEGELVQFFRSKGVTDDEKVITHWWW